MNDPASLAFGLSELDLMCALLALLCTGVSAVLLFTLFPGLFAKES